MAPEPANMASWHPAYFPNSQAAWQDLSKTEAEPETSAGATTTPRAEHSDVFGMDEAHETWFPEYFSTDQKRSEEAESAPDVAATTSQERPRPEQGPGEPAAEWATSVAADIAPTAEAPPDQIPQASCETLEVPVSAAALSDQEAINSVGSKQTSTISLTRTVVHEVSWNDEDDAEVKLPTTDSDPFELDPPNKETAAFPPFPPSEPHHVERPDGPLRSDQTEDMIKQLEEDGTFAYQAAQQGQKAVPGLEKDDGQDVVSARYAGGDVHGTVKEAAETWLDDRARITETSDARVLELKPSMQVLDDMDVGASGFASHKPCEVVIDQDLEVPAPEVRPPEVAEKEQDRPDDLESKWKDMFGNEEADDFQTDSAENEVDAAAFLGSDDEGLLEDDEDLLEDDSSRADLLPGRRANGNHLPPGWEQKPAANSYAPAATQPPIPASCMYAAYASQAPAARSEPSKVQSFADKAKGGYASPYDLPLGILCNYKPRKRASMQSLQRASSISVSPLGPVAPSRASSVVLGPPASSASTTSVAAASWRPATEQEKSLRSNSGFFKELPPSRARAASRQGSRGISSPPRASSVGPAPTVAYTAGLPTTSPPLVTRPQTAAVAGSDLVRPGRVDPYSPVNSAPKKSLPGPTRYAAAPGGGRAMNGATAGPSSRYSPAAGSSRPPSAEHASSPSNLPYQSHVASPLVQVATGPDRKARPQFESGSADRRTNAAHEFRLGRVSSLPQVQEEESGLQVPLPSPDTRHSSSMPPPLPPPRPSTQSPAAVFGGPGEPLQWPASIAGPPSPRTAAYLARSASQISTLAAPFATVDSQPLEPAVPSITSRSRLFAQSLDLIAPTDGREKDRLQRWRGSPLLSWGVGGIIVTMFPKNVPRYGMSKAAPSVMRSPGEVRVDHAGDLGLQENIASFPGPLKSKSKKKEILGWLSARIETLERGLPHSQSAAQTSQEAKRSVERLLLWRILRLLIERDGVLEGTQALNEAVRDLVTPHTRDASSIVSPLTAGYIPPQVWSPAGQPRADAVDSGAVEAIRAHLLAGDRDKAAWTAVDKRLWGHAMLIAGTTSLQVQKQVTREFLKQEVNFPGRNHQALAALYEVFSGNHEESVDQLVPVHARAGLRLVAKDPHMGVANDGLQGLDKWRETLCLVLSNRSPDDGKAINSLGRLLAAYGRAEAAHVCFLLSRKHTVFGGLDDAKSNFVLLGADLQSQAESFASQMEPLLLSEVYEYGLGLVGGALAATGIPHLAAYKLQHALVLAEHGHKEKALQYCEAIAAAIVSQTRRSPYHHPVLEAAVDDLAKRLRLAPKAEKNSWISKPRMDKVSEGLLTRFNHFISGDDNDKAADGDGDADTAGPFARIAGGTPTISRPSSVTNFETLGASVPAVIAYSLAGAMPPAANAPPPPLPRAASRYLSGSSQPVPSANPYAIAPQAGSPDLTRAAFEMLGRSSDPYSAPSSSYKPSTMQSQRPAEVALSADVASTQPSPPSASLASGYQPFGSPNAPAGGIVLYPADPVVQPSERPETGAILGTAPRSQSWTNASHEEPLYFGFQPLSLTPFQPPVTQADAPTEDAANANDGHDQASLYPNYGYQPPSYKPYHSEPETDQSGDEAKEKTKLKKKGVMHDDDDMLSVARTREKTKAEKDRENEDMFRRVAEEEAKRAEADKQAKAKKGWLGGWFGGGVKKEAAPAKTRSGSDAHGSPNKPIRAKLGEANSFYYDPDLKRWVNRQAGADDQTAKKGTPPPPKASQPPSRAASGTPTPPQAATAPPSMGGADEHSSAPPLIGGAPSPPLSRNPSGLGPALNPTSPPLMRSASTNSAASTGVGGPPSRPGTALSTNSSIDDLLAVAPRSKGGAKKGRKAGRYVDVMAKP